MTGKTQAGSQPKKPKTVSRFRNLAGDGALTPDSLTGDRTGGVVGGLETAGQLAGHRIRHVEIASLIPHPFNDPRRSTPQPEDAKWNELVRSIRAQGVLTPGLAVTRAAFTAARPSMAQHLPATGSHVLVFGHRRRAAAAEAGVSTMPLVVDDSAMHEDGDLDAMAVENLGRKDLSALAEARMFARFSEDLGLTQSDIADRLGVDQATVSRRLALLLLADEVVAEMEAGRLPVATAAALASAMPFGPPRRWQRSKNAEQHSSVRHDDQLRALSLVIEQNASPTRAAERVLAERAARQHANEHGITVVNDPATELGPTYSQIDSPGDAEGIVAAIDQSTGSLVYYGASADTATGTADSADLPDGRDTTALSEVDESTDVPGRDDSAATQTGSSPQDREHAQARAKAKKNRAAACATAATATPGKQRLAEILVTAVAAGLDLQRPSVVAQAGRWSSSENRMSTDYKVDADTTWRRVLAAYEESVDRRNQWTEFGKIYLDLLHERASYIPTSWERKQLEVMQPA